MLQEIVTPTSVIFRFRNGVFKHRIGISEPQYIEPLKCLLISVPIRIKPFIATFFNLRHEAPGTRHLVKIMNRKVLASF